MIYEYIYELLNTLFIDSSLLSVEAYFLFELMTMFLSALILRLMLSPVFYLFRIASAQYRAILPKQKIRTRDFIKD